LRFSIFDFLLFGSLLCLLAGALNFLWADHRAPRLRRTLASVSDFVFPFFGDISISLRGVKEEARDLFIDQIPFGSYFRPVGL